MRTRREHPREGCLLSTMSYPDEITLIDHQFVRCFGLDRGECKRRDGTIVFPSLDESASCGILNLSIFPPSAFSLTAIVLRSAALLSVVRRRHKCEELSGRYTFQMIFAVSFVVIARDTDAFIAWLGHLTTFVSGESRTANFIIQRLSPSILRENALSVTHAGRPRS